jgi:hypothetical protein
VTALPTVSTCPAASKPRIDAFGFAKPSRSRIGKRSPRGTRKARIRASPELTVVANDLTSTSASTGTGFGTSLICTTSGGPYRSQTAALINDPRLAAALRAWTEPLLRDPRVQQMKRNAGSRTMHGMVVTIDIDAGRAAGAGKLLPEFTIPTAKPRRAKISATVGTTLEVYP